MFQSHQNWTSTPLSASDWINPHGQNYSTYTGSFVTYPLTLGLKWYELLILITCLSCFVALVGAVFCLFLLKRRGCLREKSSHVCCQGKMHAARYHNMTQANPKHVPVIGVPRPTSIIMEEDSRTHEQLFQLFRENNLFSRDDLYHSARASVDSLGQPVPYYKRSCVAKHILLSSLPTIASAASGSSYNSLAQNRNPHRPRFIADPAGRRLQKYHSFDSSRILSSRVNLIQLRALHQSLDEYLLEHDGGGGTTAGSNNNPEVSPNDDSVYLTARSEYHLDQYHQSHGGPTANGARRGLVRLQDVFRSPEFQTRSMWLLHQGHAGNNNEDYVPARYL